MIVIDTSAVIAILLGEDEADRFSLRIATSSAALIGTPTLFETYQVAKGKFGDPWRDRIDEFVSAMDLQSRDWTTAHQKIAIDAFDHYGKGSGHKAALNFGDCMSYALAKALDVPLLFKGNDFALTDVRPAT